MKKLALLTFLALFLTVTPVHAQQADYQTRDNSAALKLGWYSYPDDTFYDFWGTDDSYNFELAYEHKVKPDIGIEVSVGYMQTTHSSANTLFVGDSSDMDIENLYISPTLKFYHPLNDLFVLYAGAGPDFYFTWTEHSYSAPGLSSRLDKSDSFRTLGFHGLAGVDWYIYTEPSSIELKTPVSIFLEYRYSQVEIGDADELVIDSVNNILSRSFSKHDLDVGGHTINTGIRWHY
jgi:opacity protein-like surface antigen